MPERERNRRLVDLSAIRHNVRVIRSLDPRPIVAASYTPKTKELNAIRAKYAPKGSKPLTNLDKAKAIDARVESKGTMAGLAVGKVNQRQRHTGVARRQADY